MQFRPQHHKRERVATPLARRPVAPDPPPCTSAQGDGKAKKQQTATRGSAWEPPSSRAKEKKDLPESKKSRDNGTVHKPAPKIIHRKAKDWKLYKKEKVDGYK